MTSSIKNYIDRLIRLDEEKKEITLAIKQVYDDAKSEGYDVKIMRKVFSLIKKDKKDRIKENQMIEMYMRKIEGGADS